MIIISLFCSLHKIHKRLYFYYYLNKWLNLVCAVSKSSHAFFYTAGFCCASFKTFCMFLLICVYSVSLNNVHLSGELWDINYVDIKKKKRICLPMQEMWVQSLSPEDPLEKEMATHSFSCLGNSMERGAWWTTVHGVAKNQTWLSNWAKTGSFQLTQSPHCHLCQQIFIGYFCTK